MTTLETAVKPALAQKEPLWESRKKEMNIGSGERAVSAIGGGAIAVGGAILALRQGRPWLGLLLMAVGGDLVKRGATGRCNVYRALSVHKEDASVASNPFSRDVTIMHTITIDKPVEEVYGFWRNFSNLPKFIPQLVRIEMLDEKRMHWVWKRFDDAELEWNAMVTGDKPNDMISWSTVGDSDLRHRGEVRFVPAPGGRGTLLHVKMQTHLPGGVFGAAAAKIAGKHPDQEVRENLRNLKQILEAGEIPSVEGQPQGSCR